MSMVKKLSVSAPQLTGFPVDPLVFGIAVFLMLYGLVMIGSASLEIGAKTYGNPFFLLTRHSFYLLVSGAAALIAISVPIQSWQKYDAASPCGLVSIADGGSGSRYRQRGQWRNPMGSAWAIQSPGIRVRKTIYYDLHGGLPSKTEGRN